MNTDNIPRPRGYHHGNLRAALVAAGLRAIAEDGPDGFTLRDVARRAGVSPAAPYRHFEDKDALLAAIAQECAARLAVAMTEAVASAPSNEPLARFRATGIAYVQFAVAHREHFRALAIPDLLSRATPEQRAAMEEWMTEQRRELEAAQAAGTIAPIPIDELLLSADALVHGLASRIVEGKLGKVDAARATELAIAVTGAFGRGLVPRPEGFEDPLRPA